MSVSGPDCLYHSVMLSSTLVLKLCMQYLQTSKPVYSLYIFIYTGTVLRTQDLLYCSETQEGGGRANMYVVKPTFLDVDPITLQ